MNSARKPLFFLAVAIVCLALLAPTPAAYRWINLAMAGLALFWFVLLSIELVGARRRGNQTGGSP